MLAKLAIAWSCLYGLGLLTGDSWVDPILLTVVSFVVVTRHLTGARTRLFPRIEV
jgi:hypothetical protein